MHRVKDLVVWGKEQLKDIDTASLDVKCLIKSVLDFTDVDLILYQERIVSAKQLANFQELINRRKTGEPVALILGEKDFWSLTLKVTKDTLIPRPETEVLVEYILDNIEQDNIQLLDLGTGTGAIALSLAKEYSNWQVTATDISEKALSVAATNAKLNYINNVEFKQGEWFNAVGSQKFDVIVSNPPYIAKDDPHLKEKGLQYEPLSALVSGSDGLDDLTIIIENSVDYLKPKGLLVLEHGYDQSNKVQKLLELNGYTGIKSINDLAGIPRITVGWLK